VTLLNEFKRDERGVTAIEYGLIGVAMAVVLAAVFTDSGSLMTSLKAVFTKIQTTLQTASTATSS
jgi:pilus assembly protein Flp/PilA